MPKLIVIPGLCTNGSCRRSATRARKLGGFWVTQCEECAQGECKLDLASMTKIETALDMTKRVNALQDTGGKGTWGRIAP